MTPLPLEAEATDRDSVRKFQAECWTRAFTLVQFFHGCGTTAVPDYNAHHGKEDGIKRFLVVDHHGSVARVGCLDVLQAVRFGEKATGKHKALELVVLAAVFVGDADF